MPNDLEIIKRLGKKYGPKLIELEIEIVYFACPLKSY